VGDTTKDEKVSRSQDASDWIITCIPLLDSEF
jgi:hypothetical protein